MRINPVGIVDTVADAVEDVTIRVDIISKIVPTRARRDSAPVGTDDTVVDAADDTERGHVPRIVGTTRVRRS